MKPVKRVEIVVEAVEINNFLALLKQVGVVGYTIIRHEAQANALVAAIRPMLVKSGGMCLVSDAIWVIHTGSAN